MAKKVVAVDVGSSHLRAMEAEIKNNQPKIVKVFSMVIPEGVIVGGEIRDEEEFSQQISKLWKRARFKSKDVVITVGGSPLQLRKINRIRAGQTDADLRNTIPFMIRDYVPFEAEDYYYDFHTLAEKRDPDDLMIYKRIFLSAISKEFTDALVRVLTKNKLQLKALEASPFSLIRAHHISYSEYNPGNVIASIDIGAEVFTISFHKNHQPVHFHNSVGLGGNKITGRISRELKITFPEAEMLKTTVGLPDDEIRNLSVTVSLPNGATRISTMKDFSIEQREHVADIIAEEISEMIAHINDILDDFFSNTSESTLNGMVFSGGGATVHSFLKRAAAEFRIPIKLAKPFGDGNKKLTKEIVKSQHQFMTLLGAMVSRNEY